MKRILCESEAHQNRVHTKNLFKICHYRNRSAFTAEKHLFLIDIFKCFSSCLQSVEIQVDDNRMPAMVGNHVNRYSIRCNRLHIFRKQFCDFIGMLTRYKPHAYFCTGCAGKYGFRPFPLIPAPESVHIKCRTCRGSFESTISFFAMNSLESQVFFVSLFIKRKFRKCLPLFRCQFFHIIIESRNLNDAIFVFQFCDDFSEYVGGIFHCTTKNTTVQVTIRPGHMHFHVCESAQAIGNGRLILSEHGGIRNENHVTLEQIFMLFDKGNQIRTPDLLFPLQDKFDVHRQLRTCLHIGLNRFDMSERLPLVVAGTAGVDPSILDGGFKRRGFPELKRFRRLHIKMAIDQNGGFVGVGHFSAVRMGWPGVSCSVTLSSPMAVSWAARNSPAFLTSSLCLESVLTLGIRRSSNSSS